MDRRDFLGAAAATFAGQGNAVPCQVVDAATGRPTAARIRLVDRSGAEVVPIGHPATLSDRAQEGDVRFQSRRFAYVDGGFSIDPSRLPLRYQAIKGFEYRMAEGELRGPAEIRLERWSPMRRDGWHSGDIHIHHIAPKTCRLEMEAEDLHVANILTSDFTNDQDQFEGKPNAHSGRGRLIYVTQEFRHDQLGHLCVLNLKKLIEPVKPIQTDAWPLHLRIYDEIHAQGGYVSWAHFPSWPGVESPLDVAMEKLDGLEILCVLEPRHFPVFTKQVVPELESNDGLRLWYRYLNCGFRLAATAGTDKMTNFVTVGANRVYARVEGELTYQGWIDALKAGRTFVTNSPMLRFTVNGREAGAMIELKGPGRAVEIRAEAESQLPYHRLEIVSNGRVIADATPGGPLHRASIRLEQPVTRSCWFAARAVEDMASYRAAGVDFTRIHSAKGTLLGDYYGTRRPETVFAHSSPAYAILDNRPIRSHDDAEYYARYLDKSIAWLEKEAKFARPSDRQASVEAFRRGRAVFVARQNEAR